MGNALKMTPELSKLPPEARAFISGGVAGKEDKTASEKVVEVEATSQPAVLVTAEAQSPSEAKETRAKRSPKAQAAPHYLANRYTVAITTRFEQRTADALRRAHLEQKLKNIKPATQQEIIELAVQAWLRENSYLD